MRVYVGFDDTDHAEADRGTGKLARWFEDALPEDCRMHESPHRLGVPRMRRLGESLQELRFRDRSRDGGGLRWLHGCLIA